MPIEIYPDKTIIKTKVLGVRKVYCDSSTQNILQHMDRNQKDYLVYVVKRNVYTLRGSSLTFIGKIDEKYEEHFKKCPEPIVTQWFVTGGGKGVFTHGLNIELLMKPLSSNVIIENLEGAPF